MRIALCLALVACGGHKESHGNIDKLKLALDGKSVSVDRAFLTNPSPDVYAVRVGRKPMSCTKQDGAVFGFTFAKRVSPHGEERWAVTDVFGLETTITVPNPGTVTFEKSKVSNINFIAPSFSASGELDAVECPASPPAGIGVPKSPHPSNAKVTVAGKSLNIKGVTVHVRSGVEATDLPNIWISTQVRDCSKVTLPAPVQLERIDGKWSLRGTWIDKPVENVDAPELGFTANMVGKSADGPTLDLQLSGSAKLGDYTVELVGVAQAIECTN